MWTKKECSQRHNEQVRGLINYWKQRVKEGMTNLGQQQKSIAYSLGQLKTWEGFLVPASEGRQQLLPFDWTRIYSYKAIQCRWK